MLCLINTRYVSLLIKQIYKFINSLKIKNLKYHFFLIEKERKKEKEKRKKKKELAVLYIWSHFWDDVRKQFNF